MAESLGSVLLKLGISPDRNGYYFIADIIELLSAYPTIPCLHKTIYIELEKKYKTSAKNIDRNVREAIREGWAYRDKQFADKLFGEFLQSENDIPTNKKFIGFVKWYMDEQ